MHLVLMLAACLLASQLLVANQARDTRTARTGEAAIAESATPWGGDYFPNTLLTDQDGRQVHFFDDLIKGKVVVINFIFTSCSDSCPLETARCVRCRNCSGTGSARTFSSTRSASIRLSDTPAVLKAYAQRFKVGPGWKFLTG
jgi:protein SCO1/2